MRSWRKILAKSGKNNDIASNKFNLWHTLATNVSTYKKLYFANTEREVVVVVIVLFALAHITTEMSLIQVI